MTIRKWCLVLVVVLAIAGMGAAHGRSTDFSQASTWELDRQVSILHSDPDARNRVRAALWLGHNIRRPTEDQVRALAGTLRADRDWHVRCAAADAFGIIARQRHYHMGWKRIWPELSSMLAALRQALTYERESAVRICVVDAASEFDSAEAQVIIDTGKTDIDPDVRTASVRAERQRHEHFRMHGY